MAKKYRKKPVVIEAMRFTGDNYDELFMFCPSARNAGIRNAVISTLEGEMTALSGDMIIKGVKDEFYPCKPDIFEQTYEEID
jgi:hypothetical protein